MFVRGMENVLSAVWLSMDKILVRTISCADVIKRLATILATGSRYVGPPVTGWWNRTSSSGNPGLRIYVRAHSSRMKLNGINTRKERVASLNQIRINTCREMLSAYKKGVVKDAIRRYGL